MKNKGTIVFFTVLLAFCLAIGINAALFIIGQWIK